ncbi:alpha/beta hydrolase, partial [bacterium M00.F.Ca.ET.191.01.1.1]
MLISIVLWLFAGLVVAAALILFALMLATWRIAAKAERLVTACGKFVDIGGNSIQYVEEGEGRPIVFLHRLGAKLHHFRHTL